MSNLGDIPDSADIDERDEDRRIEKADRIAREKERLMQFYVNKGRTRPKGDDDE